MSAKKVLSKEERRLRDSQMRVADIPLTLVKDNPYQPRKRYPKKYIGDLAKSISERGLLHPIAVVKLQANYVIVGGHCRFRAFKKLRRRTIPAIIRRESSQKDLAMDLAIENAMRKDFSPIEKAQAIFTVISTIDNVQNDQLRAYSLVTQVKLMKKRGMENVKNERGNTVGFAQDDVYRCERLLKLICASENTCCKYIRFLDLPKTIADKIITISSNESISKRMIKQGFITVSMGYEISRIKSNKIRRWLYKKAVKERWNAITLRHVVDEILETGKEDQINKLGSSKRRGDEDHGIKALTRKCFEVGFALKNFRKKIPIIPLSLEKIVWRAGLKRLMDSCVLLIKDIEKLLGDEEGLYESEKIRNETIEVTIRPGSNSQKFRFTFPKKKGDKLGLESGDKVIFRIDSIKKETGEAA